MQVNVLLDPEGAGFTIKDSGKRAEYSSGMVRDTDEGKVKWTLIFDGPMMERYAVHLTKGLGKYGRGNWLLACTPEEEERYVESAVRHMVQWLRGDRDEDHAAAVIFNINGAENVRLAIRGTV